jgi:gamma-glutamyltranspeptidase
MNPDGRSPRRVVSRVDGWAAERDPAWSQDGNTIAFSAMTHEGADLWTAPASSGLAHRVTSMPGDERWPSWTADGRIVFSHRPRGGTWQLYLAAADGSGAPQRLTLDDAAEWQGQVSPDGQSIAFMSDRGAEAGTDADVWTRRLGPDASGQPIGPAVRLLRAPGEESHPTWAPDNTRVAYAATRSGTAGVYVASTEVQAAPAGRGRGGATAAPVIEVLASRKLGVPAWSPDGETLLIATISPTGGGYNGNPDRSDADPPMVLADAGDFALWSVLAPRPIDAGATEIELTTTDSARWVAAFDQVWHTLKQLYYRDGASASAWDALATEFRPRMAGVRDLAGAEALIDEMIARQPLMKPATGPARAVVSSGHALASQAGADIIARGGNVVDAGVAVAFALGVVEPDASGLGGDGQAILFLKGMSEPVVVEYKDMTPMRATPDNPRLFTPTGGRTASNGPSVVAIPGVVAGLDLLHRRYGSGKVSWAEVVTPAVTLAEDGYILDEALPTTIEVGRQALARYPSSAKVFLPGGRVPRAGDRFVNRDLAATLRVLAKEGGDAFYRGSIARRIADDMAANGGVITFEDLAQYRAMERRPLAGEFRGHRVYSAPPPVSTGLQIVETLQILDHYTPAPGATIATDPDYFHHAIEAWRVRDGGARIADPERWPIDLGNHLDRAHARERFALIDPAKTYGGAGRGRGAGPVPPRREPEEPEEPAGPAPVQTGTTAFVVADAEGNMIAFTQTLSTWGGSYYVSDGLGFLYNDHFRGGGGRGGGFGSLLPLTRTSTTSVPTLLFAPGESGSGMAGFSPRLAVGAAGNAWIPASVYSIILNVIDGGLDAQQAIEAPRVLIGGGGGRSNVQIEDRIARTILSNLEARGHGFSKVGRKGEAKYGYAALAVVDAARRTAEAGADPRRSHVVVIVR